MQLRAMELGGILVATARISMGNTSVEIILRMLMVLIGDGGRDITTP